MKTAAGFANAPIRAIPRRHRYFPILPFVALGLELANVVGIIKPDAGVRADSFHVAAVRELTDRLLLQVNSRAAVLVWRYSFICGL